MSGDGSGRRGRGRPAEGGTRVQFRVKAADRERLQSRLERTLMAYDEPGEEDEPRSLDTQARRELRYGWRVIYASLGELPPFTRDELALMAFVCGEQVSEGLSAIEAETRQLVPVIWREVRDAADLSGDDGAAALLGRLRGLTVAQDAALRDALSRHVASGYDDTPEAFEAVGLRVRPDGP